MIGVADRGFIGTVVGLSVDLWIPIAMQPTLAPGAASLDDRDARWVLGLGRLKTEISRGAIDARHLEEHTEVEVLTPGTASPEVEDPTGWKAAEALIGLIEDAPADMAENHDQCLYTQRKA